MILLFMNWENKWFKVWSFGMELEKNRKIANNNYLWLFNQIGIQNEALGKGIEIAINAFFG